MHHNHHFAEIIANKLCQQLTSHMDYKALQLSLERSRQPRVYDQAKQFIQITADHIRYLENLQPEFIANSEPINYDTISKTKQNSFGKRVSILKIRRNTLKQGNNITPVSLSRRVVKGTRDKQKGLVKLPTNQDEEQNFTDYIEKLRQKKIKFAEVMEQFNQEGREHQVSSIIKTTSRQTNHTQRPIITTLSGSIVKCEKKQQNTKKDDIYLEKVRIRPLFKLREHVSSRADLYKKGQLPTQGRRVSISNQVNDQICTPKDGNYYIKSIIDVIANRKQKQVRRRKNNIR